MRIVLNFTILFLNIIYMFIKLFPIHNNKITFISRQSNEEPLDFKLLRNELNKNEDVETAVLCMRIERGVINKTKYLFHIFRLMYHIATSHVVVLDSYCIPICVLHHKKNLKVFQIWHALGSLKKFGYSSLDLKDGRSSKMAKAMRMHKNYDYILTSGERCKMNFMEAFGYDDDNMLIMSLPRVDYLLDKNTGKNIGNEFYDTYKKCNNQKKNILYCPTHRFYQNSYPEQIIKSVDYTKYNLIIKLHDGDEYIYVNGNEVKAENNINFMGMELLLVSDYVITDYSAIVYEASILNKPIFFYAEDLKEYYDSRGLYVEYEKEMPGPVSDSIQEIMQLIDSGEYDDVNTYQFAEKYIDDLEMGVSLKLAEMILKKMQ